MTDDPIVAEVRAARDAYASKFNYDLRAMFADLRRKDIESGRKTVRFPANRLPKKKPA